MQTNLRSFLPKATIVLFTTALALPVVLETVSAEEPAVAMAHTNQSHAAKRGEALFHSRCVMCHNKQPNDPMPFGPPNLYKVFRNKSLSAAEANEIVRNGKGSMPAFGSSVTRSQINDLVAYLLTH
jgi:mono/diheme cytochrome c family protein